MEIVFRAAGHLRTACRVSVAIPPASRPLCRGRGRTARTRLMSGSRVIKGWWSKEEGYKRVAGAFTGFRFCRLLCVLSGVATSRRRLRRLENLSGRAFFYTYYTLLVYIAIGSAMMVHT